MKPNVVAAVSALRAGTVHFHGEQHDRIFTFVEPDIGHPCDVVRAALVDLREIPRPNGGVGGGGERSHGCSVATVNLSAAQEGDVKAVVKLARVVFRGNEPNRIAAVVGVFHIRAVAVQAVEEFSAVTPRATIVVGDEIIRVPVVAAMEKIGAIGFVGEMHRIAIGETVAGKTPCHAGGDELHFRFPLEGVAGLGGNAVIHFCFLAVLRVGRKIAAVAEDQQAGHVVVILLQLLVQRHDASGETFQIEDGQFDVAPAGVVAVFERAACARSRPSAALCPR